MGFLPDWIRALQDRSVEVRVIAQDVGDHGLSVHVTDLNKQQNPGIPARLIMAWRALWSMRDRYDVLLIVMAPTWALLLAPLARFTGKRIYMWYAVWRGTWKLRLAEWFVNGILCSVPESFPFASRKVHAIGQAIDTEKFRPMYGRRIPGRILFVGRFSPVKQLETLFRALANLPQDIDWTLTMAGAPVSPIDTAYIGRMKQLASSLGIADRLEWIGKIPHHSIASLYQTADIFVNLTPSGSFDKTVLEAMSSGVIAVSSNSALLRFMSENMHRSVAFKEGDTEMLTNVLGRLISNPQREKLREQMRDIVEQNHSLQRWTVNLIEALT